MRDILSVDEDVIDLMDSVFTDHQETRTPSDPVTFDANLWDQLAELGLVRLTGPEDRGGGGAGWPEATALTSAAVRHGVRLPLPEHDLLAGNLVDELGFDDDAGVRTICLLDDRGRARHVPWAATADRIVVVWQVGEEHHAADVPVTALRIDPGFNAIGEPRDTVVADLDALDGVVVPNDLVDSLRLKSAMVRAIQTCAALDRALDLSVLHATTRIQFGRPLAAHQAVQGLIADIAGECALARAATEAALLAAVTTDWSAPGLELRVAVARSCVGHAASIVVRNAHQVHGAIGTTREHSLHECTRAALAWRSEFGSVHYWDQQVTHASAADGGSGLWELIAR